MTTPTLFSAAHLTCFKQNRSLFNDLSFDLSAGELLRVEGDNGAGKSSLLRILTGLSTPCSGTVYWQDQPIEKSSLKFNQNMHYIGHANGIKLGLTPVENLTFAQHQLLAQKPNDMPAILDALKLSAHKDMLSGQLSAGQKRRLALARLFLFKKQLWIVDEPLTALDAQTQAFFLSQLKSHLDTGGMAVITSHQAITLDHVRCQTLRIGA